MNLIPNTSKTMADTKNTTKIIDLKIKGEEALGTIEKLSKELEIQKNKLKELNAEAKSGNALSKEQKEDMIFFKEYSDG